MDLAGLTSAVIGAGVIVLTLLDIGWTSLTGRGSGPLLKRLSEGLWAMALWLHRRRPSHARLGAAGVVILVAGYTLWIGLLWAGWTMVFMSQPDAILESRSRAPAGAWERIYYVGYSLTTLGIGDYVAGAPLWRLLTILVALTGFSVLTLSVTYLLSLLAALAQKRALAHYLAALGATPAAIISNHWRNGSCEALLAHVPTLMELIETLTHQHAAYPTLHYFHASEREAALPLRLAGLHDSFLLLEAGAVDCEATRRGVQPLRRSVAHFLINLEDRYLARTQDVPPPPPLDGLTARVLACEETDVARSAHTHSDQRNRLLRYVLHDGWKWDDVYADSQSA